jgi:CheY-like chemotaxis protein
VKHNGMDALQWLNEATTPPDYIFLDINMPVMDGKECLVEIRKNPRLKEIPVIIYSTASEPREIATLYFLGASSYITKPRSYNELMPVLLSFFEKSDSSKHCIESQ